MRDSIQQTINESIAVKQGLLNNQSMLDALEGLITEITQSLRQGNKLVLCGNGGSASDALHFAGEILGRFAKERDAWPAVVLNADVATMTSISNDYGFDDVFARQAQGHCHEGDVFIGISTSGNSENILRAANMAKSRGAKTAAFLGKDGGKIGKVVDYPIIVPCDTTPRVQESHILLIHIICEMVEKELCNE